MTKDSFIIFIKNNTTQEFEFNDSVSKATPSESGYSVTFNNGKIYNYSSKRVKIYPLQFIRNNVYVYRNGILISGYNIAKDYGRYLIINNEYCHYQIIENNSDIEIADIKIEAFQGNSIIDYFKYMLRTIVKFSFDDTTEDDGNNNINNSSNNHLLKALDLINTKDSRSVFSNYVDGVLPSFKKTNKTIIYPFGCNESQKAAVETALQNNMSIIEGPPGTGKTQTILNIIANLVVQGKTIGVVSNNNSAIFNILEKLQKSNYDMIAAPLGNKQNKTDFFNNIQDQTPNKDTEVSDEQIKEYKKGIKELDPLLTKSFQFRNRLEILKTDLSDAILEYKHIKAEQPILPDIKLLLDRKFYRKLNANKALRLKELLLIISSDNKLSFKVMLILAFQYGIFDFKTITRYQDELSVYVNHKFYELHIEKLELEIANIENWLLINNEKYNLKRFVDLSNKVFNNLLLKKYASLGTDSFTMHNYINRFDKFVKHYPVILSSTHSLHSSIPNNYLLDYIIIDEASQVDLVTSSICFSCSRNVVVVGDSLQLTHIVEKQAEEVMIKSQYSLHPAYDYVNHNILNSLKVLYDDKIETTLLREHYRCHPTIIGFCNKKYYNNNLVVMTRGDNHPFRIIETNVDGERGNYSQKQIDETNEYIEKRFKDKYKNIGVIAPYRIHVEGLQRKLNNGVESDTIHKFQGRDKDVIIFNTVKGRINKFIDNPNLINVAVSRAKHEFIIVKAESMSIPHGSNIGDLIRYINYTTDPKETVIKGSIRSVFDILYKEYNKVLISFLSQNKDIEGSAAEIIIHKLIHEKILLENPMYSTIGVIREYRLRDLVYNLDQFSEDEIMFIRNNSRIDFLLYNKIDKTPILAIEVDGVSFHDNDIQRDRDAKKNNILHNINLPLLRLATNEHNEEERIIKHLQEAMEINQNSR